MTEQLTPVFEYECNFLAAVLQQPEDPAVEQWLDTLVAADFADERTRKVYASVQAVWASGQTPEVVSVSQVLASKGQMSAIAFLTEVMERFLPGIPIETYGKKVLNASQLRRAQRMFENALDAAVAGLKPVETIYDELIFGFDRLFRHGDAVQLISPGEIAERRLEGLRNREKMSLISTGWFELDKHLVAPFAPGDIVVIKGPAKSGKSQAKSNIIDHFVDQQLVGLHVCPEQQFMGETDRQDAIRTGVPLAALKNWGAWHPDDERRPLIKEVNEFWDQKAHIHYYESRSVSMPKVRSALRKVKDIEGKVDFVAIDLFDRLSDVQNADNRTIAIEQKLQQATQLAQEFSCCFILLVQENAEGRTKWAGAYEEYASLILEVQRPKLDDPSYAIDELILSVYLQRNGPSGGEAKFIVDEASLKLIPQEQLEGELGGLDEPIRGGSSRANAAGQGGEEQSSV